MHNRNNEFILLILYYTKMANFERQQLEIWLKFMCWSAKSNNFSKGLLI